MDCERGWAKVVERGRLRGRGHLASVLRQVTSFAQHAVRRHALVQILGQDGPQHLIAQEARRRWEKLTESGSCGRCVLGHVDRGRSSWKEGNVISGTPIGSTRYRPSPRGAGQPRWRQRSAARAVASASPPLAPCAPPLARREARPHGRCYGVPRARASRRRSHS